MSKGTLYTSKAQANVSTGARQAWMYFEDLYPYSKLVSIQFDFTCQEWVAKFIGKFAGNPHTSYASKAEMENFK